MINLKVIDMKEIGKMIKKKGKEIIILIMAIEQMVNVVNDSPKGKPVKLIKVVFPFYHKLE